MKDDQGDGNFLTFIMLLAVMGGLGLVTIKLGTDILKLTDRIERLEEAVQPKLP